MSVNSPPSFSPKELQVLNLHLVSALGYGRGTSLFLHITVSNPNSVRFKAFIYNILLPVGSCKKRVLFHLFIYELNRYAGEEF